MRSSLYNIFSLGDLWVIQIILSRHMICIWQEITQNFFNQLQIYRIDNKVCVIGFKKKNPWKTSLRCTFHYAVVSAITFRQRCSFKHLIIFFLRSVWIQLISFMLSLISYPVITCIFTGYKSQINHPHQFSFCILVIDALSVLVLKSLVFTIWTQLFQIQILLPDTFLLHSLVTASVPSPSYGREK